ncbi:MAG: enoyl-CoA hydratase/isomerase family protein [Betaproteobacteria bacterium]|nr:enoyl-CoA hydratase/isomerase family protein [Betaproteobacteria bacterium]
MPIDVTVEDHIATVVINRPEAMNSIDPEMREQLHGLWDRMREDDGIHVAIVTGAGDRAFCTGSDLKKTMPPKESFAELLFGRNKPGNMMDRFGTDKPLIAAVNGYAVGGGLELALACDICIASENARFGLAEVRIGSIPGSGGVQRLPRTVSKSNAMLMLLTGDQIDAAEACRIGIVSKVVPLPELMPAAQAIARRIAENAPLAVRAVKRLVLQGMEMPLPSAIELDRYVWGLLRDTEDRIEGRKAFAEKRKPRYKGR